MIKLFHLVANDSLLLNLLEDELAKTASPPPARERIRWDAEDGDFQTLVSATRQAGMFSSSVWIDIVHSEEIQYIAEPRRRILLDTIPRTTLDAVFCFFTLEASESESPFLPGITKRFVKRGEEEPEESPGTEKRENSKKEKVTDFWKEMVRKLPISLHIYWKGKIPRSGGAKKESGYHFQRLQVSPTGPDNPPTVRLLQDTKVSVSDWLISRARAIYGLQLEWKQARTLLDAVGEFPSFIDQALKIIRLRNPEGKSLSATDLDDLPGIPESRMYYLAQDAFSGNLARAAAIVDLLQRHSIYPGIALATIARDVERFILVRKALQEGHDPVAALNEPEFRLRAFIVAAKRANPSTSAALMEIIHRADLRFKITDDNPYEVLKETLFRIYDVVPRSG
jgi:DNA polymerase III delta subunit